MKQAENAGNRADYLAMRKPPVQYLDQEWVDSVSQAIENFRKLKEQQ
jgi:DNA-directed RNA polymerase subunit K/omega